MSTIKTDCGNELTILQCWCGVEHAVPTVRRKLQLRQFNDGEGMIDIYCPEGHKHYPSGQPKYKKTEKQLRDARDEARRLREEVWEERGRVRDMDRRRAAEKGAKTKLKNEIQELRS